MFYRTYIIVSIFLLTCLHVPVHTQGGNQGACSTSNIENDLRVVAEGIEESIADNPNLSAAYVRAAFHDCIPAVSSNSTSGCNVSLRLAAGLDDDSNSRLGAPIAALNGITAGTCVSMADAIQLACAIATRSAGGPDVISEVVNAASPRVDATQPDNVTELPDSAMSFDEQEAIFTAKGFTVTDMVASVSAAHGLGTIGTGTTTFTPDRNVISPNYAWNLVQLAEGASDNAPEFNTLQSETALISDRSTVDRLQAYSVCAPAGPVCADGVNSGLIELNPDFAVFLIKLSRVNGLTVGQRDLLSAGL